MVDCCKTLGGCCCQLRFEERQFVSKRCVFLAEGFQGIFLAFPRPRGGKAIALHALLLPAALRAIVLCFVGVHIFLLRPSGHFRLTLGGAGPLPVRAAAARFLLDAEKRGRWRITQ